MLGCTASVGCNAVIGADEPAATNEKPSNDDDDRDGGHGETSDDAGGEAPICGDGKIQFGEQCDDADDDPDDGCHECRVVCDSVDEYLDPSGHCYFLDRTATPLGWTDAEAECEAWGATLAVITTSLELSAVQTRARETAWIGGRDAENDGTFEWVNGEAWEFESWAPEEPSGDGRCIALQGESGSFAVRDCDDALRFLCERPPPGL